MSERRDDRDDATNWAGDDDPILSAGWTLVPPRDGAVPDNDAANGDAAVSADRRIDEADRGGAGDRETPGDAGEGPAQAAPISSVLLVTFGVISGIYLLYTLGWLVVALRPVPDLGNPVDTFMYTLGRWLAVFAPAVWFTSAFVLMRDRIGRRMTLLIVGVLLLAPLPFAFG